MTKLFDVVFAGEVSGTASAAVVRANVGKLLGVGDDILDQLFSGQPVTLLKKADQDMAMILRAQMKLVGANTRMIAVDDGGQPLPPAGAEESTQSAIPVAGPVPLSTGGTNPMGTAKPAPPPPADVGQVTTWALFPRGWLLGGSRRRPLPSASTLTCLSSMVLVPASAEPPKATTEDDGKPLRPGACIATVKVNWFDGV